MGDVVASSFVCRYVLTTVSGKNLYHKCDESSSTAAVVWFHVTSVTPCIIYLHSRYAQYERVCAVLERHIFCITESVQY